MCLTRHNGAQRGNVAQRLYVNTDMMRGGNGLHHIDGILRYHGFDIRVHLSLSVERTYLTIGSDFFQEPVAGSILCLCRA